MYWYLLALKKYAQFEGRSRRSEFWFFALFNLIIGLILGVIDTLLGLFGILSILYGLAVLIPGLAVGVRRLHDIGQSGWLMLIGLVPFLGALVLLILFVMDSKPGENQYGENPKDHQ